MLHAGRLEIEGAKKTAEQVIGDVKAIKGVFQWFIGLFTAKPTADAPKPVAKKKIAAQQQSDSLEHTSDDSFTEAEAPAPKRGRAAAG